MKQQKHSMLRRVGLVLLALCLGVMLPLGALAAENKVIASGEEATYAWKLTDDGTMTVSGTEIPNETGGYPWADYKDKIQSVVIEKGITTIGDSAFESYENLTKLSLADTVSHIGYASFFNTGLTTVLIPASVSHISFGMGYSFNPGVTYEVAEGNEHYRAVDGVLYSNTELLSVPASYSGSLTVPEGIKSIPWYLFMGGTGKITEIFLPASITELEPALFGGSDSVSLTAIHVAEENPNYCSIGGILYNKEVTKIVAVPGGITNITIPDGVTGFIDKPVELHCYQNLVSITLPASVTEFGYNGFAECERLETVIFKGDAPKFKFDKGEAKPYDIFAGVTANVYYPAGNTTWTEENMLDYGGKLTWIPYYPVLEGDGSAVTEDDGKTLAVRVDAPIEKFEAVEVDGKTVAKEHYDVTAGSTVVTLHGDYLATLTPGEHSLTLRFTDGVSMASFTVKAAAAQPENPTQPAKPGEAVSPVTGDTFQLVPAVLVLAGALALVGLNWKKRMQ